MKKRYYRYGLRPVIEEKKEKYSTFYVFQWDTGDFKEDMSYFLKIYHDESSESEELTKKEFDAYVGKLKDEKGL